MKKLLLSLSVVAFLAACSTNAITGRKQLSLFPESTLQQEALTQYQTFLSQNKVVNQNTSKDAEMVRRVGTRIAQAITSFYAQKGQSSELDGYKWEFNLVDNKEVNAWCMPGGKVVVYTGLLPVTQNETALAVVLGHEIAHAIARHGNERMSEALLINLGGVVLEEALKTKKSETQTLFLGLYMIGSNLALALPNSRMQESEADKLGLIFMSMAGYDPNEAIPFWQRMAANNKSNVPQFLSTHPSDETRIKKLSALLPEIRSAYYKQ